MKFAGVVQTPEDRRLSLLNPLSPTQVSILRHDGRSIPNPWLPRLTAAGSVAGAAGDEVVQDQERERISLSYQISYVLGLAMIVVYGFGRWLWPVYIPATIELCAAIVVFSMKLYYDWQERKQVAARSPAPAPRWRSMSHRPSRATMRRIARLHTMTNMETFYDTLGLVGSFFVSAALVPQIVKVFRSKSAKDISKAFQSVFVVGIACITVYGMGEGLWPIWIPSTLELLGGIILLAMKHYYDWCDTKRVEKEQEETLAVVATEEAAPTSPVCGKSGCQPGNALELLSCSDQGIRCSSALYHQPQANMPPKKKGGGPSKKSVEKQKDKTLEDKTFGLKNKKKSKNVQKYIQEVTKQVKGANTRADRMKEQEAKRKKDAKAEQENLKSLFAAAITQPKGNRCKFSHDLMVGKKAAKIDLYTDTRAEKEADQMDTWDQEKLEKVVNEKHHEKNAKQTEIVCKHFLDAIEKSLYGWFWCARTVAHLASAYRHALPPGYVFKSKKDRELEKGNKVVEISIEEIIEQQRAKLGPHGGTPVTEESLAKWKADKLARKKAEEAKKLKEQAKRTVVAASVRLRLLHLAYSTPWCF
ncbi:ZC3H15/TMA46 family, C-terminal [Phytophthora cactorum]|nr:ZC3H15/TMA46 family, C-terminal [Phytophthora cactorum]